MAVKAVSDAYPLRGKLQVSRGGGESPVQTLAEGPRAGTVWPFHEYVRAEVVVLNQFEMKPGVPLVAYNDTVGWNHTWCRARRSPRRRPSRPPESRAGCRRRPTLSDPGGGNR